MKHSNAKLDVAENFTYSDYESFVRLSSAESREAHRKHLAWFVQYFRNCNSVLDLACGEGIFLDLLRDSRIPCIGVDADSAVVRSGMSRGHRIVEQGVIEFVNSTPDRFDGIFCSHLIEHLPFDEVLRLIQGVSKCILSDGIFVLAFPNPRALRSHLNMFWIDPQHVRFYDGSLVKGILEWSGFTIISDSENALTRSDGYRFAPRGLLNAIGELELGSEQIDNIKSSALSKTRTGLLQKTKARLSSWLRQRLGITMLAEEIDKLNRALKQTVHFIEDPDWEVRLVSRKIA